MAFAKAGLFHFPGDLGLIAGLAVLELITFLEVLIVPAVVANVIAGFFDFFADLALNFFGHTIKILP